jgi:hypothetical protein
MQEALSKADADAAEKRAAEQEKRAAGIRQAAQEAADKLKEIEEHQKETQQLTLYVPFAKKVVEAAHVVWPFKNCCPCLIMMYTADHANFDRA